MSQAAPTTEQFNAAENYALEKLCLEIPSKYGGTGMTQWDPVAKVCKITEKGCTPGPTNPISQFPTSSNGTFLDFPATHPTYGEFWKYFTPDLYVMKVTPTSNNKKICSRGSSMIYQWCNYPEQRAPGNVPGLTTKVQPFQYQIVQGKETCLITQGYCTSKGLQFDANKLECYKDSGLQAADFFGIGTMIQDWRANGWTTNGTWIGMVSDKRLKDDVKIFEKDYFGPGVHLYSYRWNTTAYNLYGKRGNQLGVIADTLPSGYTIRDTNGYLTINFNVQTPLMQKIRKFYGY